MQDQILRLLHRIRVERGLSIVFVTHDLGVVRRLCDRVAVMYAGQVVETGRVDEVFTRPTHPYSAGLLRSMPTPDTPRDRPLAAIPGGQPGAADRPEGCRFAPRCAHALPACARLAHTLAEVPGSPSRSACLRVADLGGPPLDRRALVSSGGREGMSAAPLLQVDDVVVDYRSSPIAGRRTTSAWTSRVAAPWAWSGSRDAASPAWPGSSPGSPRPPRAPSGSTAPCCPHRAAGPTPPGSRWSSRTPARR